MKNVPAKGGACIVAWLLFASFAWAQASDVQRILDHPKFRAAGDFIDRDHDRITGETIQITEIEAPPFKEEKRATAYQEMLRQSGLMNVEMDAEGNVMGIRKGARGGPLIAIAAHLDTVFPEGTNVKVKRMGTKLSAPGIGDDSRALAVLLAMIRAMDAGKIQTASDILFVGDVGEEGPGDLRGMKYLFQKGPYKDRIKMFISMDGAGGGSEISNGALGSKRYKVTFKGPGGHSYGAFGIVNPAFALGNAINKLSKMQVPSRPRTTFNVGVVGGGTSVNSIPYESWMEVDIRSESREELNRAAETLLGLMHEAVDEENKARSTGQGRVELDMKLIGDRPSGEIPVSAPLVQTASAVIKAFGMTPYYSISSTDSNIPISLGIPAITIDSGGRGGRAHALDEWIDVEKGASVKGINVALGILLSLAGME
ncbi:MAG TPA: M20/M25/M40 family metallo-hydrolase [Terriglobia bacterium]|nr:M20/M25/M40 family metallo-hydrolase [Terriglobia bacterium]